MAKHETSIYLIDDFVSTAPGEPYRLFKFGRIFKNGNAHDITPESAARFRLPHFDPPIKLGSHDEAAPAGGHIKRLEVRADGLWAIPDMTPKGAKALAEGDYRYQSPEVVWEDGAIEDPKTGELMNGPFIVGDALLHTPHLGNEAALYSYEIEEKGHDMLEKIEVEKGEWDLFQSFKGLFAKPAPKTEPPPAVDPEKYAAAIKQADELGAKVAKMESDRAHEAEVMSIVTDLQAERFGVMFKAEKVAKEAAEAFSGMTKEQREWVMQKFAALAGQIDFANAVIGKEFGIEAPATIADPVEAFTAVITEERKADSKMSFATALKLAASKHPDMAEAYQAAMKNRGRSTKKED